MSIFECIFSSKNQELHKVINILGLKLKLKSSKLVLQNKIEQITRENREYSDKIYKNLTRQLKTLAITENRTLIKKNSHASICVILHLFYMENWNEIKNYLEILTPYNYDLIVTCVNGFYDEDTLKDIQLFKPETKIFYYENKGYDIGPFIDVLNYIDLDNYDIVYKLHSKGIHREFIYIYHQIFKKDDWFYNLYNGILSESTVHHTIDTLMNSKDVGLVAAENLIIQDPKHKVKFTQDIAKTLNINLPDNYQYVAGSCFAISAECLKRIKNLKLTIENFQQTERGEFSFAHAMERIVCALIKEKNKSPYGIPVFYNQYQGETCTYNKFDANRLLEETDFSIDYDFFYRGLETRQVISYKVKEIALKDIKRRWFDGKDYSLKETSPYKFLSGKEAEYEEYCIINKELSGFNMSKTRFNNLISSFNNETFDHKYMPVVDTNNVIMDGQHRCCIMLHKFGEDYKIKVLELTFTG